MFPEQQHKKKRTTSGLNFKIDADLQSYQAARPGRKARSSCTEQCVRYLRFCGFCLVCTGSLFQALAPWMLSAIEVATILLVCLLGTRMAPRPLRFNFRTNLEDIVMFSVLRALVISGTYAYGNARYYYRPFLYSTYLLGAAGFVYALVKGAMFEYTARWLPPACLMIVFATFSWVHILAARFTVDWARRRLSMGLMGLGYPWEEGEEGWLLLREPDPEPGTKCSDGADGTNANGDIPPECLAEPDSQFLELNGLRVHVREVAPLMVDPNQEQAGAADDAGFAIVLIHGFGGGAFSWRHVMEPLAMQCQARVVVFDRPAFGLTSRPPVDSNAPPEANPYTIESQAQLTLQLCSALGLQQVVLVGHADGSLVALTAAAMACRSQEVLQGTMMSSPIPCASLHSGDLAWLGSAGLGPSSGDNLSPNRLMERAARLFQNTSSLSNGPSASVAIDMPAEGEDRLSAAAAASTGAASRSGSEGGWNENTAGNRPGLSREVHAEPSALADACSNDVEVASTHTRSDSQLDMDAFAGHAWQQQRHPSSSLRQTDDPELQPSTSASAPVSGYPSVVGLALLHPTLSGHQVPPFARLLARTKMGRSVLRPLLRSELGEVANRRAWHNTDKLNNEVLELYKAPLKVDGWDAALVEAVRHTQGMKQRQVLDAVAAVRSLPALLVTGEFDRIATRSTVENIARLLPSSHFVAVPNCGHLSHEESPAALLAVLTAFCGDVMQQQKQQQQQRQHQPHGHSDQHQDEVHTGKEPK